MTVLERLKAAGYDPAVSLFPDSIGNAGSMECERIQIRTFFCRPRENEAAIGVTATAMTHFSDGSTRPYPDGWPRSLEASVTLYFAGDAEFHYFGNVATDLVGSDAEFRYFSEVGNAACCAVDGVAQFAVFHQLEQRGERVLCLHDFAGVLRVDLLHVELINRLFHACLLCPPAVEPLPRIQDLRRVVLPAAGISEQPV